MVSYDLAPFDYPERNRVTAVQGDIRDAAALERAMTGCTHAVHCAAALPLYTPADIFSTDVDGTRYVLAVARRVGCARVVHISSTAVYGVPDHHPLFETDPMINLWGEDTGFYKFDCIISRKGSSIRKYSERSLKLLS